SLTLCPSRRKCPGCWRCGMALLSIHPLSGYPVNTERRVSLPPTTRMTLWTLAARSLRFHWRAHLGVLLGATLGTAILVGALAVGDSVRYSLRELALMRLGEVRLAVHGQGRFFRAALADELAAELKAPVAPALLL